MYPMSNSKYELNVPSLLNYQRATRMSIFFNLSVHTNGNNNDKGCRVEEYTERQEEAEKEGEERVRQNVP